MDDLLAKEHRANILGQKGPPLVTILKFCISGIRVFFGFSKADVGFYYEFHLATLVSCAHGTQVVVLCSHSHKRKRHVRRRMKNTEDEERRPLIEEKSTDRLFDYKSRDGPMCNEQDFLQVSVENGHWKARGGRATLAWSDVTVIVNSKQHSRKRLILNACCRRRQGSGEYKATSVRRRILKNGE